MEGSNGLLLVVLISLLGSINAYYIQETIIFPMRYVDHSIDLGISSDELNLPSGKCEDTTNQRRDLSLILPHTCAPRTLYSGFITSDRVTCLSLRESLIESISYGSFDRLPNLFYLDLSKNRIQFCDLLSFGGHPSLTTLVLDENSVNVIDNRRGLIIDRADFFPRLKHLYLRKNFISTLRVSISRNFPILSHLYLSGNLLTSESLNDLTDLPLSLSHLYLERNQIRRVESQTIRNVRFLFLDGNAIGSICSNDYRRDSSINLRGATKLRFLSLSGNEIVTIDRDSFVDTWNLRTLNLANNRLESIAIGTFDNMRELVDLSLSNNRLRYLPNFETARMLTSLTIDHNYIERLYSGAFRNLERLKWLSLSGNRLRIIDEGAFRNVGMLEELDLSDNKLDRLSWSWIACETPLRLLDLRGNRFTSYDNMYLRDLASLTDLYVKGNPFRSLESPKFDTFSRNVNVHAEYGLTYATRPCYVTCGFDRRLTQLYDYAI